MRLLDYNSQAAVNYARRWALGRNPAYYDFQGIGGDCTNFISQCIYAGSGMMNYAPDMGWFYRSMNDRSASWTGVEYLYRFLTDNRSVGPYGNVISVERAKPGDVIQLGSFDGDYYHSLLVLSDFPRITVAAHSADALDRPLESYSFDRIRCIHISGVRGW